MAPGGPVPLAGSDPDQRKGPRHHPGGRRPPPGVLEHAPANPLPRALDRTGHLRPLCPGVRRPDHPLSRQELRRQLHGSLEPSSDPLPPGQRRPSPPGPRQPGRRLLPRLARLDPGGPGGRPETRGGGRDLPGGRAPTGGRGLAKALGLRLRHGEDEGEAVGRRLDAAAPGGTAAPGGVPPGDHLPSRGRPRRGAGAPVGGQGGGRRSAERPRPRSLRHRGSASGRRPRPPSTSTFASCTRP